MRDNKGRIASVRYKQINAMLLNEFLKETLPLEGGSRFSEQGQKVSKVFSAF